MFPMPGIYRGQTTDEIIVYQMINQWHIIQCKGWTNESKNSSI